MILRARIVFDLDDLVIMVNPRHMPLYRYLYFDQKSEVRTYAGVNHAPAVRMHMDLHKMDQKASAENPVLYRFFHPEKVMVEDLKNIAGALPH